jgi:hypothetical protein
MKTLFFLVIYVNEIDQLSFVRELPEINEIRTYKPLVVAFTLFFNSSIFFSKTAPVRLTSSCHSDRKSVV